MLNVFANTVATFSRIRNVRLETRILISNRKSHTTMGALIKSFCFTAALSSDFSLQRALTRRTSAFTWKRCHYSLQWHATRKRTRNCTKVVPVQKTGPPVLRNAKTRKSTASGEKKRLHHRRKRNVHAFHRARDRKYFWSYHFTRRTRRIPYLTHNTRRRRRKRNVWFQYRSSEPHIFWHGADWFPTFSWSAYDQLVELTT